MLLFLDRAEMVAEEEKTGAKDGPPIVHVSIGNLFIY